jgi:pyruvate decarboxylase
MPLDLADDRVPRSLLDKPIDLSPPVDNAAQDAAVSAIVEALSSATKPSIFVDALVHRYGAREECRALAAKLQIPTCAANMGKSIIDETESYFAGIYMGQVSEQSVAQTIEGSDCVLVLGAVNADTNSGAFSRKFSGGTIHINANNVVVSFRNLVPKRSNL